VDVLNPPLARLELGQHKSGASLAGDAIAGLPAVIHHAPTAAGSDFQLTGADNDLAALSDSGEEGRRRADPAVHHDERRRDIQRVSRDPGGFSVERSGNYRTDSNLVEIAAGSSRSKKRLPSAACNEPGCQQHDCQSIHPGPPCSGLNPPLGMTLNRLSRKRGIPRKVRRKSPLFLVNQQRICIDPPTAGPIEHGTSTRSASSAGFRASTTGSSTHSGDQERPRPEAESSAHGGR
jgi:hypothetical protein